MITDSTAKATLKDLQSEAAKPQLINRAPAASGSPERETLRSFRPSEPDAAPSQEERLGVIRTASFTLWCDSKRRWESWLKHHRCDQAPVSELIGLPEPLRAAAKAEHLQWTADTAKQLGKALRSLRASYAMEVEAYGLFSN